MYSCSLVTAKTLTEFCYKKEPLVSMTLVLLCFLANSQAFLINPSYPSSHITVLSEAARKTKEYALTEIDYAGPS